MISYQTTTALRGDGTIALTITKQHLLDRRTRLAARGRPGLVPAVVVDERGHWLGTLAGLVLLAVLGHLHRHRRPRPSDLQLGDLLRLPVGDPDQPRGLRLATRARRPAAGSAASASASRSPGPRSASVITLAGYHMSGRGAGDVKLAAAIGALLGVQHGVFAVAYSYIVAAVAIIIWSTWVNGPLAIVKAGAENDRQRARTPLAVSAAARPTPHCCCGRFRSVPTLPSARCWWCWSWCQHGTETRMQQSPQASQRMRRRGMASLEVVMTTLVMLPIAAAILWLGFKLAATAYQVIGALVAWPFL